MGLLHDQHVVDLLSWEDLPNKGAFDQGLGGGTRVYPAGAVKMKWHQVHFSEGTKY